MKFHGNPQRKLDNIIAGYGMKRSERHNGQEHGSPYCNSVPYCTQDSSSAPQNSHNGSTGECINNTTSHCGQQVQ